MIWRTGHSNIFFKYSSGSKQKAFQFELTPFLSLFPHFVLLILSFFFLAHNNVDWYGGQFVQIAKKLGLPEIIYPSDNRNDLYVIVNCGKFSKGNKLRDRNVEVTLEVCDEKGNPIKGAISSGKIRFILNLSKKILKLVKIESLIT
jgi:hypothetical protein